ncbi:right-handed parallel beta-helix repeat-containing protein [Aureispira anguillae]|uniref:Right-handed parallel beta-helix repeat-containing protein n=1 Tax=Aureispira anguillae TaxID=2864201 RepID=A0A915YBH9_9BACT|nr:right-handed parallel beta-helix repeat-containing protein [Aureispira anguillae]BDS10034.1 right-handed parallel beta-helix repeat-containing protein [Aureispira anguillae]
MNLFIKRFEKIQLLALVVFFLCSHDTIGQLSLPWIEDFEGATAATYTTSQNPIPGLTGTGYSWEGQLGPSGRLRTNAGAGFYHGGSRAITLDRSTSGATVTNYLIANLDLSNYGGSNDLELTFWYSNHGEESSPNDRVWMRGSSSNAWVQVYDLYANRPAVGQYAQVVLDIDALMQTAGQAITSTFQIRFGQEDNFPASSPTASDGFSFDDVSITGSLPLPNNAGITAMLSPVTGAAAGTYPIDVTLHNFGNNALDTVTVEWEMGGVAQPSVLFTGPTLAQSTGTTVNLSAGTAFPAGTTALKFWTSNPNNLPDPENGNDTLEAFFCTGLSGVYTVGTATADYPTFQDALSALYSCGVSGPVTMQVQAGAYTSSLVLDQAIPGISATNTVTWDGSSQTASIIVNGGAAVTLDGANYITIQNFVLGNTSTSQGWGVLLTNTANYNQILNNRVQMPSTNAFNTAGIVATASPNSVGSSGNNANYTLIEGNVITGADRGISLRGQSTSSFNVGNTIRNNDISDADNYGVYSYYQDSLVIEGNYIHDFPSTFHYGVYAFYSNNYDVVGNDIRAEDYGIYMNRSNSQMPPQRRGLVANNMVQSTGDRGIYMVTTRSTDFYHNTIVSAVTACTWSNFDNTIDIKNNIFVSTGLTSFAFETFSVSPLLGMDNNVFYTDPANPNLIDFGGTFTDLADWQTNGLYGYDQNSLEGMPQFNSPTDLHVDGAFLNDKGVVTTVTTDIDGDVRPAIGATSVDIGADEFTPPANDAGVSDLASPSLPITGGFAPVEIVVTNYGISDLASFSVEWEIGGVAQVSVPYTGAPVPVGGTTNMILANINFPQNTTSLRFWTTQPNGVTDERPSNDTLDLNLCPGLAGTYSVGHTTSDFVTAADAIDALMTCGVNGPVTMEFVAGTYTGPWILTEIPGASATNTVTFDGLNAANAILTHNGFGVNTAATLLLDGVDHFTIKNFTIENTGTNTAYGVLLTNSADYNTLENNTITVLSSSSLANVVGVLASGSYTSSTGSATEGNNANHTLLTGNDIRGGISAVIFEGGATNVENVGNQIIGNMIHDAQDYGIYADEQDSFAVNGNKVYDILAGGSDAVMLFDIRNFTILSNEITTLDYGIAVFGGFNDPCRGGLIANNMVESNDEALYIRDVNLIQVSHNTFKGGNRTCFLDNHLNIDFRNNIMETATGTCFFSFDNVSMAGMDYNLYSITGNGDAVKYGTPTYATLANWQTNPAGYGANSVTGNPGFVNGLHVSAALPVDAGVAGLLIPILEDFDGETRPMGTAPDIGADEHIVIADDAMAVGLVAPSGCGDPSADVIVEIANIGFNALISSVVTVNVSGDATATFNTTQPSILPATTAQINMGTINTAAGGTFNFEVIVSSSADLNPSNDTFRITLNIPPSNQIALSMTGDTMVCDGNTAAISATASYAPATILWYDAPTGGNLVHIGNAFTTGTITANTMYYAEIQGCNSPRAIATVNIDTLGINVDLGADQTICGGSAATITPTVTVSPATSLVWSDGSLAAFIEASTSGMYTATVTNINGCTDTDTVNVTVSPTPNIGNAITNVSCGGFGDGAINLTVTGGTGPYSYLWNTTATTEDLTGLNGGFYMVTVTDSGTTSNCAYVATFQVTEPTALFANVNGTGIACDGNNGTIDITVAGGTPNYSYNWSPSAATTQDLTNASAGTHTVTITDANGCTSTVGATVAGATPIVITVDTIHAEILAIAGGIEITATGGTGNFQYVWNTGATSDDITGLVAGSYDVTVTDITTGCQQVLTGIVVPYKLPDFVNNIPSLEAFKLYPNPTADKVWVNMTLKETTTVQLEIMGVTGKVLQSFAPRETLEQNYEIDLSTYPSGVYLARFIIGQKVMTTKVIVE